MKVRHFSHRKILRIQVTVLSQLLNTKLLNVIQSWIWSTSCLLKFVWTTRSTFLRAETKLVSACVSQLPLGTSANKSAASAWGREWKREGWVRAERCESRGSPPPPLFLYLKSSTTPADILKRAGLLSTPAHPVPLPWTIAWTLRGVREPL